MKVNVTPKIMVTVVIPAFNVENYILFTLKSVQNQTLDSFECIIVDDYSKDNTKKVCLDFMKGDKRFKLISHRANGGLSAARNTGLRAAQGKYICFLDSDDLFMVESLEVRVNTLEHNQVKKVIGTYCGSIGINQACEIAPESIQTKLKKVDFITAGGNCPFNANQPMFKRLAFLEVGGFDHSLKQAEDYDMWMRILRYGYQILPTQVSAVTYRATPGSMIKRDPMLHLQTSFDRFMACYEKPEIQEKPVDLDGYKKFLNKGLSDYLAQLNVANRVLEFVGIALAVGKEFGLANKLADYLPDYFKIIESHRPFTNGLIKGLNRGLGYNINSKPDILKQYMPKVEKLREDFFAITESLAINEEEIHHGKLSLEKKGFQVNNEKLISQTGGQSLIDIVFIPHKDYHVSTIAMIQNNLFELGLRFIIVDISMHYRDEGVKRKAQELELPLIGYSNFLLGKFLPKLFVSFNDWDPIVRSIMVSAQKAGISTSAVVEGIQDYDDADTKQTRWAYRTVDTVFLPGEFDAKYFANTGQFIETVGVPRIHILRQEPKIELDWNMPNAKALINSNFSYGVLDEARDQWVKDAVEACLSAGFEPVISRHPADVGSEYKEYQTNENFYDAIRDCVVHISKFASGILEALAVGCPVIYFNPHGEQVDKFKTPIGAYLVIESKKELIEELRVLPEKATGYLANADQFLDLHAGYSKDDSSEKLSSLIASIVTEQGENYAGDFQIFRQQMLELDCKTGSFNNIKYLRDNFKATYSEIQLTENNTDFINSCELLESDFTLKSYQSFVKEENFDKAGAILKVPLDKHPDFLLYQNLAFDLALKMKKNGQKNPKWLRQVITGSI